MQALRPPPRVTTALNLSRRQRTPDLIDGLSLAAPPQRPFAKVHAALYPLPALPSGRISLQQSSAPEYQLRCPQQQHLFQPGQFCRKSRARSH
jgi:hypothetical protein